MTLVKTKRNGSLFPSSISEFFDTDFLALPSFFDLDNSISRLGLTLQPSVNITESDKNYLIELAAPGLEKKDFKVEIENGVLTISAEKEEEEKEEKKNYRRREFSYQSFSRSFDLPENSISEKIEAQYEGGILKLTLPKKEVTISAPKKEIKVA